MLREVREVRGGVGEYQRNGQQRNDYREDSQHADLGEPLRRRQVVNKPERAEGGDYGQWKEKEGPV